MANVYFNALDSGDYLSSSTVSYHFSDSYYAWNSYEKAQFVVALSQWSSVANISFQQTSNLSAADFVLHNVDDAELGAGDLGAFDFPGGGQQEGWFNYQGAGWDYQNLNGGLEKGGYGFTTILHEIGHGLGLAHPHDRAGDSSVLPGVDWAFDTGRFDHNQGIYTVMSYNSGRYADNLDPDSTPGYGWTGTPMAFDIYAIQQIYGANMNHRGGNTVYRLPEDNEIGTNYQAIWDTGGRDTIRYDGNDSSTIDLRAASLKSGDAYAGGRLSSAEGIYGGYTIANGVLIENAEGGEARDIINGNSADNMLDGNGGNDRLVGFGGDDHLIGGSGNDALIGRGGMDRLSGRNGDDRLVGGSQDDIVTGGSGDDTLGGNSGDDRLRGGGGNDRITGGSGDDKIFTGAGHDVVIAGGGDDQITFGSGIDRAIFSRGWGDDQVKNFTLGQDLLDFSRISGLNDFSQLTIRDAGKDTVISYGADSVTLHNVAHTAIDEDDVLL